MNRPIVLDLFCGEGGAAKGYWDAGFFPIGVESNAKALERYPYKTVEDDWYEGAIYVLSHGGVALIHASPPCQHYSILNKLNNKEYPDLIDPVRELLIKTGIPYVIENVPGAPLRNPVMLCGSMFGRFTDWPGKGKVGLKRHRLFETSFPVASPGPCSCREQLNVPVYGHGAGGNRVNLKGPGCAQAAREVMGIDWMTRCGLDQSIPPCYSEYIGNEFLGYLNQRGGLAA